MSAGWRTLGPCLPIAVPLQAQVTYQVQSGDVGQQLAGGHVQQRALAGQVHDYRGAVQVGRGGRVMASMHGKRHQADIRGVHGAHLKAQGGADRVAAQLRAQRLK
ncbi:hypothetical protein D3C77_258670 [compost metagenome]